MPLPCRLHKRCHRLQNMPTRLLRTCTTRLSQSNHIGSPPPPVFSARFLVVGVSLAFHSQYLRYTTDKATGEDLNGEELRTAEGPRSLHGLGSRWAPSTPLGSSFLLFSFHFPCRFL